MKYIRIIPRLDIKGPNLIKGIHLEGLRVLGKPEQFARYYYECGADELIYMDIVASLYNRNNLINIIERTARDIFIPLIVGGGLRTIDDIRAVLRAGADRVAVNTAVISNPKFLKEAVKAFGSSTIVVSIEAIEQPDGHYLAYTNNGREYTGVDVFEWVCEAAELGAGEILLTSVDREGTGLGFDLELTRKVSELVSIPVIACGGAGKVKDIKNVIVRGKADAVSIASMLHYKFIEKESGMADYVKEGNTEYLKNKREFQKLELVSINEIKNYLSNNDIFCRTTSATEILDV